MKSRNRNQITTCRASKDGKVKEAQAVTTTPTTNSKCNGGTQSSFLAAYVEWTIGDRCEALYKEDNKYYPGTHRMHSLKSSNRSQDR